MKRIITKSRITVLSLIAFFALNSGTTVFGQALGKRMFNVSSDSFLVSVNNPVIDSTLTIRGVTGFFPQNVLTTISVTDAAGNTVSGLASQTEWLTPDDRAENGMRISEIWQPLVEYHKERPDYPENQNIFDQIPEPRFTEIRENEESATSVMLAMDFSWSMTEVIDSVRTATKQYVDSMDANDRAGIIQFGTEVGRVTNFTNDKNILNQGIDYGSPAGYTALFDALGSAIELIRNESSPRRAIIAYTDGRDTNSEIFTPEAVIDSAKASNIPIYMIGLGYALAPDTLARIAEETGGEYVQAANAAEMATIYKRLSQVIRNYYVMVHSSPDPYFNNTHRVVDFAVSDGTQTGYGTGQYFVPGPGANDISVSLTATSGDTIHANGSVYAGVYRDSIYTYTIEIENLSENPASNIRLSHILPEQVDLVSTSLPTVFSNEDSLVWRFESLESGQSAQVSVSVFVPSEIPENVTDLVSSANVFTINDENPANDSEVEIVKFLGTFPRYEGQLKLTIDTPNQIKIGENFYGRIMPGESYSYQFTMINHGNKPMGNAQIHHAIPKDISPTNFSLLPSSANGKDVVFTLPVLQPKDSIEITITGELVQGLPLGTRALHHVGELQVADDADTTNNIAEATIYALVLKENADLDIALASNTERTDTRDGITRNAIHPGEIYTYTIDVKNNGPADAENVVVRHELPDSVYFSEASFNGASAWEWTIPSLPRDGEQSFTVSARSSRNMPYEQGIVISTATFITQIDTAISNNTARDTLFVMDALPPEPLNYDLGITTTILTDTSIAREGEVAPAVRSGSLALYTLAIENFGIGTAKNIQVLNTLPEHLTYFDTGVDQIKQEFADLVWSIDSIQVGQVHEIKFFTRIDKNIPSFPFPLVNKAEIVAQLDTVSENNISESTLWVIESSQKYYSDISVTNFVETDSFAVADDDTLWYANNGAVYTYHVQIKNNAKTFADTVWATVTLPNGPELLTQSVQPEADIINGKIEWFFETIEPFGTRWLHVQLRVPSTTDADVRVFTQEVAVEATNDNSDKLDDNTDSATVYNVTRVPSPEIRVEPEEIFVADSVKIFVRTPVELKSWDIFVHTADGNINSVFADNFIASTTLPINQWVEIPELYRNAKLYTAAKEEVLRFELRSIDYLLHAKSADAFVTVRSRNEMVLERNLFRPGMEDAIGINFKLSSNRDARLDLYDLAGTLVTTLTEGPYDAGWNTYYWNGITKSGQSIGAGVYLVTLRSGEYTSWKKMVVVR